MSDGRVFLDTNVFVYSFDDGDRDKRRVASALIAKALRTRSGVISTQVIQEFLNVATRKFARPLTVPDCRLYLERVLEPLCEVFPSMGLLRLALDLSEETRFSFYDSLVLAAAVEAACPVLLSEDLQDGREIRGTVIANPFVPGYKLD